MYANDFFEIICLLLIAPIATLLFAFRLLTGLYVYLDAQSRSHNRLLAGLLAASVTFLSWPAGFFAYFALTVVLDRRSLKPSQVVSTF
ncbi:MAG: hypothetical protein IT428_04960 [Planctomycetaceae bacterium]|nr:hypothetical protein [Planctomycetaceae bacterium]